jgi:guanosine-3',5'-bis(diphosphate) 3'-pyrophosphohydrolase
MTVPTNLTTKNTTPVNPVVNEEMSDAEKAIALRDAHERKEILKRYNALMRSAYPMLQKGDAKLIKKAFMIAHEAHKEVRRKSGEPYIYHPLEVAQICVDEIGLGATSIIAALLHDVVEDTETKLEDLEGQFGKKVARIIDGVTKIKAVMGKSTSEQAENFKKLLLTINDDIRVVLVKIADRLHNMRTLDSMTKEKQLKIKSETQYIYAPLAHRLGLYSIKSELEDLCLKFSDEKAYNSIKESIEKTQASRDKFIEEFVKPIKESLDKLDIQYTIKSRLKSIYSIWMKMKKQGIPFEEVFDLFAIRIIADVPFSEEKSTCWRVYSAITDFYTPSPERLRDWISLPKSNGYESLHTTVMSSTGQWVEVQIRTVRMDEIAEKGYAAHWKYKHGGRSNNIEQGFDMWLAKIRETLENKDVNALEFMDEFRSNLFNEEVYIFTPNGELKVLPQGATVLDFAFEIHSEIGAKCLGAKVNGTLVPLNHVLKNGDQVEILTSTKVKANEGWLKFITTSKAKSKIKAFLKEDEKKYAVDGKEIIQRKLKNLKVDFTSENMSQLADFFTCKNEQELYYKVGKGLIDHTEIRKFVEFKENETNKTKVHAADAKQFKEQIKQLKEGHSDELVIGEDSDRVEYSFATCCNPIPGDEIFGLTTVSRGIKVHRTNCPNAVDIMASFGNRIIKARWASDKNELYEVNIKIIGTDRAGLVNDVTRIISSQPQVTLTSIAFKGANGVFEGDISLGVHDNHQATELIERFAGIEGVVNVYRYDY